MLVYDVSNRESFEALDSWLEEIKRDIGSQADFEGVVFAVCANKVRLPERELLFLICLLSIVFLPSSKYSVLSGSKL